MILALVVGCGGSGHVAIEASGPTSSTASTMQCSSAAAGYTVHYPATWSTVEDGPVPCRFFHPAPFELPRSTHAAGLAVNIQLAPVPFDEIVPPSHGTTAFEEVLSRRNGRLSGRPAVRIESRTRATGLVPAGVHRVTWYVDAGRNTLVASTSAASSAGTFAANAGVLDDMVAAAELRPGPSTTAEGG